MKTWFENDTIWKRCKFRCNCHKFTIYGAKDIYYFQRFQWRYFWIEISTIYPQMKTFASHVNFIKIEKSQNSRNYIWDEFLPGWVLTLTNGNLGVGDGFETNSWPHRHSGCNFKKWWIFMIFDFFELWVLTLIRPNIDYPAEYRPIDVIFQEST